jgi:sigma-B regulation protein RsbU (phosphoserine phosphatase)
METSLAARPLISRAEPVKVYGNSVLLAARHFDRVTCDARTLELADEMRSFPAVEVVAVVDRDSRPLGIIRRERIFDLLGKPFGREVLGRTAVAELAEVVSLLDVNENVFSAAGSSPEGMPEYRVLVSADGRFRAVLSSRDLSDYLSRMTRDDIELAGDIQSRLEECNEAIDGDGLSFSAWSRAARGVGGDFWFTRRLDDGTVFFCLCDVSGKGVAASLVVSMVWGMLLMYDYGKGLPALLAGLNESIIATFRLERYLTGFFAILDSRRGTLSVADMGHSHAIIAREGRVMRLRGKARNLPIGISSRISPQIETWKLLPGDSLLVYSDGLVEQEGPGGREFGETRLSMAFGSALESGTAVARALPSAVDAHRGDLPQQDDMSFMCLGYAKDTAHDETQSDRRDVLVPPLSRTGAAGPDGLSAGGKGGRADAPRAPATPRALS